MRYMLMTVQMLQNELDREGHGIVARAWRFDNVATSRDIISMLCR